MRRSSELFLEIMASTTRSTICCDIGRCEGFVFLSCATTSSESEIENLDAIVKAKRCATASYCCDVQRSTPDSNRSLMALERLGRASWSPGVFWRGPGPASGLSAGVGGELASNVRQCLSDSQHMRACVFNSLLTARLVSPKIPLLHRSLNAMTALRKLKRFHQGDTVYARFFGNRSLVVEGIAKTSSPFPHYSCRLDGIVYLIPKIHLSTRSLILLVGDGNHGQLSIPGVFQGGQAPSRIGCGLTGAGLGCTV